MAKEVKRVFESAEIQTSGNLGNSTERTSTLAQKDNQRALRAIRGLRLRQKQQGAKIGILCRDIVGAHSEFVLKMSSLSSLVEFQEQLLGISDLAVILDTAAGYIKKFLVDTATAIFLIEPRGFDIHFSNAQQGAVAEKAHFEHWFTPALVQEISRCNQICTLEKLLEMGLQAAPSALKHITAAAVPIGKMGKGVGFIFVYRPSARPFQPNELSTVLSLASAIRIAIQNSQIALTNAANTSFTV